MTRLSNRLSIVVACLALGAGVARAQDSTPPFRGITIIGTYDPTRDKIPIAILPISGAFGDSIRTIIDRDLNENSDRFTRVAVGADLNGMRAGTGSGLNYQLFKSLHAAAIVQITTVGTGLHIALHDVAQARVARVWEMPLRGAGLGRDWRMGVHRASDEIEKSVIGKAGIAASRIAYMRSNAIRIVDSDGASEITVPTEEMGSSPAWSPDGSSLLYSTYGPGSRIFMMDLATGRSRPILGPATNTLFLTPAFSPDGNSILYARSSGDQSDIYLAPISSPQSARRLTVMRGLVNTNPVFSPNSRRVAYVSNDLGRPELYFVYADCSDNDVFTEY